MVFHIPRHGVFALNVAVPLTDGIVEGSLRIGRGDRHRRGGRGVQLYLPLGGRGGGKSGLVPLQFGIPRLFRIGEVAAVCNQLTQPPGHGGPFERGFPFRVIGADFHAVRGPVVHETAASIQKGMTVTIPAVVLLQELHGLFCVGRVLIKGINPQLAAIIAAAMPQQGVDFLLGDRKRAGRFHARPFHDVLYLFRFCGEKG